MLPLIIITVMAAVPAVALAFDAFWIGFSRKKTSLMSLDLHKPNKILAAKIGGLPNSFTLTASIISLYLIFRDPRFWFVGMISLTVSLIGIIDDFAPLGNLEKILFVGFPFLMLSRIAHPIDALVITIPASLFLIIAFLFGTFAGNATNILAGFNGLEVGLFVIASFFLLLISVLIGNTTASLLLLLGILCYVPLLVFNWYPAKAFPGNVSTLQMGAFLASVALISWEEVYLAVIMVPYLMDFLLKVVSWGKTSQKVPSKVGSDGLLNPPPNMSLPALILRLRRMSEKRLVISLYSLEIFFSLLAVALLFVHSPA